MLYELLGIADGEIQKACQRILALIPVDPTVLSALAIKVDFACLYLYWEESRFSALFLLFLGIPVEICARKPRRKRCYQQASDTLRPV